MCLTGLHKSDVSCLGLFELGKHQFLLRGQVKYDSSTRLSLA